MGDLAGQPASPSGETGQDSLVGAWPLGQGASCELRMPPLGKSFSGETSEDWS